MGASRSVAPYTDRGNWDLRRGSHLHSTGHSATRLSHVCRYPYVASIGRVRYTRSMWFTGCSRGDAVTVVDRLTLQAQRYRFSPPLVSFAALMVLVSCAGPGYKVATTGAEEGLGFNSGLDGVLAGQGNPDGTACFWISNGADRTLLVWPKGYSAGREPLSILDATQKKLATVGDKVSFRGGLGSGNATAVTGCTGTVRTGTPREFLVAEVIH
jgi:hypothetical protein